MPTRLITRRKALIMGASLLGSSVVLGAPRLLLEQERPVLNVASAGSLRAMVNGPLKTAAAKTLGLELMSHAGGADAIAQSLVDGSLQADVFIPITSGPMLTVMQAGLAEVGKPIASTELVIFYSPKSRFVHRFEAAARAEANWWEVLETPGLRLVRSDPTSDPSGRAIIFVLMLSANKYRQADLVEKILGSTLNPAQILPGGRNQERLHSGDLDATAAYLIGAGPARLPYITLPSELNLSHLDIRAQHPELSLSIADKTFYPEPLVFYAAALKNAANPTGASAFVKWLQGAEAQAILRHAKFGSAEKAASLHSSSSCA